VATTLGDRNCAGGVDGDPHGGGNLGDGEGGKEKNSIETGKNKKPKKINQQYDKGENFKFFFSLRVPCQRNIAFSFLLLSFFSFFLGFP
jgi:hypothetical protein